MAEMTIQDAINAAIAHHQAGRLAEAEHLYRQILAHDPNHADVLHRLGVLAGQVNRHDIALDLIRRAATLQPTFPPVHYSLGNVLRDNGRLDEAIASYQQAIKLDPNFVDAHNNLGNALRDKNRLDDAILCYRKAVALAPGYAAAQMNLGDTLRLISHLPESIAVLQRAVTQSPNNPAAYCLLGTALQAAEKIDESIPLYRKALSLSPNYLDALNNLASALRKNKQLDEAVSLYRRALVINPKFAVAHNNLGGALQDANLLNEAIECFNRAIELNPSYAEAYSNLGAALQKKGRFEDAIAVCEKAVEINPILAEAQFNLGKAISDTGRIEDAISHFRKAVVGNPKLVDAHTCLIFSLNFLANLSDDAIFQEHRRWDEHHTRFLREKIQPYRNDRSPDRRLKIGYVSADFKAHSVAYFLEGLLSHHDPAAVEVFCYANVKEPDAVTAHLRRLAHQWRDTDSDEQTVAKVREDQIDILIDLAGHSAGNRLLAFAEKPTPVQVTYLGYPNTTGLSAIDYRLTDAYADPPGMTEQFHSEKLLRLPQTFLCFRPSEKSPPVSPLPAEAAGQITFGCFNGLPKFTAMIVGVWSEILHRLPQSRLMVKNYSLADAAGRRRLLELFENAGIPADRLDVRGWIAASDDHLSLYNKVDIALDTYPYHGTTTTCEALWMGVPVITLAGNPHRSRVGISILSNVGLPELIAQTPDQFVQLALDLAGDLPRLAEMRSGLREKMRQSPLMDAPRFARNVEAAYRQIWRTWCEDQGAS
jgi:protein O-GlcNAc transferase